MRRSGIAQTNPPIILFSVTIFLDLVLVSGLLSIPGPNAAPSLNWLSSIFFTLPTPLPGVLIPLYIYPTSLDPPTGITYWNEVINAKNANPNVRIVAIINPSNGPGLVPLNRVGNLLDRRLPVEHPLTEGSRHHVLGYVHTRACPTCQTLRPIGDIQAEIVNWNNWYQPNGIFFDEMSNLPGNEGYYSSASQFVTSLGMTLTIGNPGSDTLSTYVGTVDTIVIFEKGDFLLCRYPFARVSLEPVPRRISPEHLGISFIL